MEREMDECTEMRADLSGLITGGLEESRKAVVEAHLERCAECTRALEATRALFRAGGAFVKAVESAVPFDLAERVRAVIEGPPVQSGTGRSAVRRLHSSRSRSNWLFVALPLVAAAAVVVVLLALPRNEEAPGPSPAELAALSTPEQQTEEVLMPAVEVHESEELLVAGLDEPPIPEAPGPVTPSVTEALPEPLLEPDAGRLQEMTAQQPGRTPGPLQSGEEAAPEAPVHVKEATVLPIGRLAMIDGSVYYKQPGADKWFKAAEGTQLLAGAEMDTRLGRAAVEFAGGRSVSCDDHTLVRFSRGGVRLERGAVYCETTGGQALVVVTPDGQIRHLGTKFLVKTTPAGTTVVVKEGRVAVRTEQGEAEVSAGFEVRLRKGLAPGRLVRTDPARHIAWVNALRRERLVFAEDFNSAVPGGWPAGWEKHKDPNRRGYEVLRDPADVRGANLCLGCPNPPGSVTQHAGIPLDAWSRSFRIELRVILRGARNSRTGMEMWDENAALSVEYDAAAGVMKICENRAGAWRTVKPVPFTIQPMKWTAWTVSCSNEGLAVSVDGVPVVTLEDTQGLVIKSVSLISRGDDTAYFDDVRVFSLGN